MMQPMEDVHYRWRGALPDAEMVELVVAHGGRPQPGWWDQIRPHSLGWVTARRPDGLLVGFVNVAWDGGDHAFLLDPKVRSDCQRRGIGTELISRAAARSRAAGCEWLHVDFEARLEQFYLGACGFRPTPAGLIHLPAREPFS
jgi:ribosomal protein S18 acetylase RimI-like enzyme